MRPSRAKVVQAWLIEEERSGIVPGACADTGPLVQIVNTTPARIPIALQASGPMQTDFGAANARIASSIKRFRSNRAFFLLPDDTRDVELRRDAWTLPSVERSLPRLSVSSAARAPRGRCARHITCSRHHTDGYPRASAPAPGSTTRP